MESAVSFGLGALLGATGLWQFNKQSAMRGLKKGWYRLNFSQKTDRILNFVGSGIWNLIKGPGLRTVGGNKQAVQKYIQNQEREDLISSQISMVEYYDPFEKWLKSNGVKKNKTKK